MINSFLEEFWETTIMINMVRNSFGKPPLDKHGEKQCNSQQTCKKKKHRTNCFSMLRMGRRGRKRPPESDPSKPAKKYKQGDILDHFKLRRPQLQTSNFVLRQVVEQPRGPMFSRKTLERVSINELKRKSAHSPCCRTHTKATGSFPKSLPSFETNQRESF